MILSMGKRHIRIAIFCLSVTMLFFQNCAMQSEMEQHQLLAENSQSTGGANGPAPNPTPTLPPVIVPPTTTPPTTTPPVTQPPTTTPPTTTPPVTPPPTTTPPVTPADTTAPTILNLISNQVADGDSTTSTSISFSFAVSDAGSGVRSRECRISFNGTAQSYVSCATATTHAYSNLAPGNYSFRIRATDNSNNQSTRDYAFTVNSSTDGGTTPGPGGSTPPPSGAVSLGTRWLFIGDSQTAGRSGNTYQNRLQSPVRGAVTLFNGVHGISATSLIRGNGGQTLRYHKDSVYGNTSQVSNPGIYTWVHFQESGGQDGGGQGTPYEYAVTLRDFIEDILTNSPNAVISTETAFSFGDARARQAGRNWGFCTSVMTSSQCTQMMNYNNCLPDSTGLPPTTCPNYNLAQRAVIEHYRSIRRVAVYHADVNFLILEAEKIFQPYQVWYQPYNATSYTTWYPLEVNNPNRSGLNYHYTFIGNLIVALGMYDALGYNVKALTSSQLRGFFNDPNMNASLSSFSDADMQKILSLF